MSLPRRARKSVPAAIDALESRQLFAVTAVTPLTPVTGASGGSSGAIDLSTFFDDPTKNSRVRFTTPSGNIDLELLDTQKPVTTQNFLKYVRSGRYDGTFIHRATQPTTGLEVIQGGGYALPNFEHIETDAPIANEFATNGVVSNTRGTISMAKTSDPNSATSEFFVNAADNATALDNTQNSGGFTVFGNVINETLATVDAIAALPTFAFGGAFGELPVRNYAQADFDARKLPEANNVVSMTATTLPELTFTATSSNPALVTPSVTGNALNLAYGSGPGTATITVTATDGTQTLSGTFAADVTFTPVVLGGDGGVKSIAYTDADGTTGTINLRGEGVATVNFNGTGITQENRNGRVTVGGTGVSIANINVTGTGPQTSLTIAAKGGDDGTVAIGGLTTDAAMRSVSAKDSVFTGTLDIGAGLGALTLGTVNDATITTAGPANERPSTINLGAVSDTRMTLTAGIKSLRAVSFADGDGTADTITAPSIGSFTTSGDSTVDLSVAGGIKSIRIGGGTSGDVTADTLGSYTVNGSMTGAQVLVTQGFAARGRSLNSVKVGGTISGATIRTDGNIGSITADALASSNIAAGLNGSTIALPAAPAAFGNAASIGSLRVRSSTAGSIITAANLGRIDLGTVTISNNGAPFGVTADKVASLSGSAGPGSRFNFRRLDDPTEFTGQLAAAGLTLGDAVLRVV